MDTNTYYQSDIALKTRIAEALEALVKINGESGRVAASLAARVGATAESTAAAVTPADAPRDEADAIARQTAAAAQDKLRAEKEAAEAKRASEAAAEKKAADEKATAEKKAADEKAAADMAAALDEPKAKAPSVDECRAALKVFATTEGNPAAIALLNSFGANAVSALDEGKRADFIVACK